MKKFLLYPVAVMLISGITAVALEMSKPGGNRHVALNTVSERLQPGNDVSLAKLGDVAGKRSIRFHQPILTGRLMEVQGLVGDARWMSDFMVTATHVSGRGDLETLPKGINPDGSFDIEVPLASGPGIYEVTFQAPLLEPQVLDDISYSPAATWSIKVR